MTKNNVYALQALILIYGLALPTFTFSASRPQAYGDPRKPAGKQPAGVLPPKKTITTKPVPKKPEIKKTTPQPIESAQEETPAPVETEEQTDEEGESVDKPETKEVASSTKEVQATMPQPGIFTRIYMATVPVILVTIHEALGSGIGATTKSLIKQFMHRHAFTILKKDIQIEAETLVETGYVDKILKKQLPEEALQMISKEEKLNLAKGSLFEEKKIDPNEKEKQTSLPFILGQAAYTGMLYTAIPMVGALVKEVATRFLITLMPTAQK